MKVLAVDDEIAALRLLKRAIGEADETIEVESFTTGDDCLTYCGINGCPEIAFLDIRIGGTSGLDLAREIKTINPQVNIIFTTGFSEHASDAFGLHASGYLLKPATPDDIKRELENLRFPIQNQSQGIYLKTFGNFEAFFNGEPLSFKYRKSKELLAYLFDRQGSLVSNTEVMVALWETEGHENYFRQIRKDVLDTLARIGCTNIIVRHRGSMGMNMDAVTSDYQNWQKGLPSAINAYRGEYMAQYSWAETTNASLW